MMIRLNALFSFGLTASLLACGGTTHDADRGNPQVDAGGGGAGGGGGSAGGGSATMDGGEPMGQPVHAKQIAVGIYHACAVLDDDTVACWGENQRGELGVGATPAKSDAAIVVPGLRDVARLVVGMNNTCVADGSCALVSTTCALQRDGHAMCWGPGELGQLGNGKQMNGYFESRPVAVALDDIVDLAMGYDATCAATKSERVDVDTFVEYEFVEMNVVPRGGAESLTSYARRALG